MGSDLHILDLGWTDFFAAQAPAEGEAARVIAVHRGLSRISTGARELDAELKGTLRDTILTATGDFVRAKLPVADGRGTITQILERRTKLSRRAAGRATEEQVLAANVDAAWIVMGLDADFSLRRLERYLILAREGGVAPVIILSKADLADDVAEKVDRVAAIAGVAAIHALSNVTGEGLQGLIAAELSPRTTIALLGSSGVGKSTLSNRLLGHELQPTAATRASDGTGRHTTTARELIALPNGALLIDTPGLREVQPWIGEMGLDATFPDVAALAASCRFGNCSHGHEPGCALKAALDDGTLDDERWASYRAMQRELAHLERKNDARLRSEDKKKAKTIERSLREHYRHKGRG